MVYPYSGKLLINKKEWITDTFNHMDESQVYYAKWKRKDKKDSRMCLLFHLYEILEEENYKGRNQIGGC